MTPILFVPGWQNSEKQHWQSIWQKKFSSYRVEQADWQNPSRGEWLAKLATTIAKFSEPPILVSHSLGTMTAAILSAESKALVRGAFMVAPVDLESDFTPFELRNFLPTPFCPLRFPAILIGSESDPYCNLEKAKQMAGAWNCEFINLGHSGHINVASGFGPWLEGEALLQKFVQET